MIIDQFRDLSYSHSVDELKFRAKAYAIGALFSDNIADARKMFRHANTLANKAHELENNQRRFGK